uniref:Phytanoyl-CoA dioxygenase n=1 Tax=Erythrolobus australicus TaxID=1077150 RepID=A0A7S1XGP7_9RHOD
MIVRAAVKVIRGAPASGARLSATRSSAAGRGRLGLGKVGLVQSRRVAGGRRLAANARDGAGGGGGGGKAGMDAEELFWFDLNGFLVVRGALSEREVAGLNAAIDAHLPAARARDASALKNAAPESAMTASGSRVDMGGMLAWEEPAFRELLTQPTLTRYLTEILGKGFRLDHQPLVIVQSNDSEGFALHGGPLSGDDGVPQGRFNPELQYRCVNGTPWTSLLAASVSLCDAESGDGGFCVLRGSHKLNFAVPSAVTHGLADKFQDHIHQPAVKKGDIILFSEATVHGALPWRPRQSGKERRLALLRFAPANMAYGRAYTDEWGSGVFERCTPAQRAVLQPPYAPRLERAVLSDAGEDGTTAYKRSEEKRAHDAHIFGTPYF